MPQLFTGYLLLITIFSMDHHIPIDLLYFYIKLKTFFFISFWFCMPDLRLSWPQFHLLTIWNCNNFSFPLLLLHIYSLSFLFHFLFAFIINLSCNWHSYTIVAIVVIIFIFLLYFPFDYNFFFLMNRNYFVVVSLKYFYSRDFHLAEIHLSVQLNSFDDERRLLWNSETNWVTWQISCQNR